MDSFIKILILAVIGGLIGYVTNVVAIKLIFRPLNPIKIPILNIEILGVIPKRKGEIAKSLGDIIEREFISVEEIVNDIITKDDKEGIVKLTKKKIQLVIDNKMAYIPSGIRSMVQSFVVSAVEKEIRNSIEELFEDVINNATERINIAQIVESKINELDLLELENIILYVAKEELKHIEILGLILGFLIGIVQGLITLVI